MRTQPHYPRAEVQLNQNGTGKVLVQSAEDQEPVDVTSVVSAVSLHASPKEATTVKLTLAWVQATADGDVKLCEKTTAALLALGWTPPTGLLTEPDLTQVLAQLGFDLEGRKVTNVRAASSDALNYFAEDKIRFRIEGDLVPAEGA